MPDQVRILKITGYEAWQEFLLRRVSNAPVHVFMDMPGEQLADATLRLCHDPEVYALYVLRDARGFMPESLPDCDVPVFIVADETEAERFASHLLSGDYSILDNAVNGDEVLYRYLASHQS